MIHDFLLITFICAAMNHLGLVAAAEGLFRHRLPVLNCPKCSAFWLTLLYGVLCCHALSSVHTAVMTVAAAFLMAYIAVWTDLIMGGIDILYSRIYAAFYPAAADAQDGASAAETDRGSSPADDERPCDAVSALRHVTPNS